MKIAAALILLLFVPVGATQYFVLKSGNDNNAGTPISQAVATINRLCDLVNNPGDTGNIGPGIWTDPMYTGFDGGSFAILAPKYSGANGDTIVFQSIQDSARATLDGQFLYHTLIAWEVDYIMFLNLEGTRGEHYGAGGAHCSYTTFRLINSNHTRSDGTQDNGCGVTFINATDGSYIDYGNKIQACTLIDNYSTGTANVNCGGIETYGQVDILIEDNVVAWGDSGISAPMGIHLKAHTSFAIVRNNTVHDFTYNEAIAMHHAEHDIEIYGNIVYNCMNGVRVSSENRSGQIGDSTYNIWIYNNTFYNITYDAINCGEFPTPDFRRIWNYNSWNNIVADAAQPFQVVDYPSIFGIVDYNCYVNISTPGNDIHWKGSYFTLAGHQAAAHYDSAGNHLDLYSITIVPYVSPFVNAAGGDFRLDTLTAPYALLHGGRGNGFNTYLGALNPLASNPPKSAFTISGTITRSDSALAGVAILGTTTNGSGYYSVTHDSAWGGTATPYLPNHSFIPGSITYLGISSDQENQDYTAFQNNISGRRGPKFRR